MIPPTMNGLPSMACLSALQKFIRRGMEREAMEMACELIHTSKAFNTMVCNRLQIISHEDIDIFADPNIVPFVKASCEQAKEWYVADKMKLGKTRMAIGNAIRIMCRAKKSREGDHFNAAIGLSSLLEGFVPEIPEWVHDQHTLKGKKLGRGLEYFREVSTKLIPASKQKDAYEDEAYRLWEVKANVSK